MGLLKASEWQAKWICYDAEPATPLLLGLGGLALLRKRRA